MRKYDVPTPGIPVTLLVPYWESPYHQIKRVENCINNRPVRKFNYLTLNHLYNQKLKVAFIT